MRYVLAAALLTLAGTTHAEDPPELRLPPGEELVSIHIRSLNPLNSGGIEVTTRKMQGRDVCVVYRYNKKKESRATEYERTETLLVIRGCAGK